MNPYQKIVIDGKEIQKGHIDTIKKFDQLMKGVDLSGKRVVDIGCNLGMMCRLAREKGVASILGIDIRKDYIETARKLHPDISFKIRSAEKLNGNYDIAILSSTFHYIKNWEKALNQMARTTKLVICDIWVHDTEPVVIKPILIWDKRRRLFVPNKAAWHMMASRCFGKIEEKGVAESPDLSTRIIYHLSNPKPVLPEAILIYGTGGLGKTTLALTYLDHVVLQLDIVFISMLREKRLNIQPSVMDYVDTVRENGEKFLQYQKYHQKFLKKWMHSHQNQDVVIEGYDMIHEDYRNLVRELLEEFGWKKIEEISL